MLVWLNGTCIDAREARVGLLDGGYLYGDGVFETVRLYLGRPFDLEGHLDRMTRQLEILEYDWRPDVDVFRDGINALLIANGWTDRDARCRLTVSRGGLPDDPLPLSGHRRLIPTVSIIVQPVGDILEAWQEAGIAVFTMPGEFARGNFPHLKTLNYLPTIMALRHARAHGCDEALLIDNDGWILEGATSNVFIVEGGTLKTPPLALGLLPGRTRAMVLELAGDLELECGEHSFRVEDLRTADEAFVCGSVKEIVPIVAVDGRPAAGGQPGPVTRRLQEAYRRGVRDTLGGRN